MISEKSKKKQKNEYKFLISTENWITKLHFLAAGHQNHPNACILIFNLLQLVILPLRSFFYHI